MSCLTSPFEIPGSYALPNPKSLALEFLMLMWLPCVHILKLDFLLLIALCHFNYSTSQKNQEGKRGIFPPSQEEIAKKLDKKVKMITFAGEEMG